MICQQMNNFTLDILCWKQCFQLYINTPFQPSPPGTRSRHFRVLLGLGGDEFLFLCLSVYLCHSLSFFFFLPKPPSPAQLWVSSEVCS